MKRWWYKEHNGTGIVPIKEAAYFKHGADTHTDMAELLLGQSWQTRLSEIPEPDWADQVSWEPWCRRVGWMVAFDEWIKPDILAQFEVLKVEHEIILDRGDLWIACTPDVVLRDKRQDFLVVPDFKSVGILGRSWINHWPYAIQQHLLIKAVEEEFNLPVKYAQIIGLKKGNEDDGKLRHPYVWAWHDGETYLDKWKYGANLAPVYEYPGGVSQWVLDQGEEIGREQFPFSAPVFLDNRLLDTVIRGRRIREATVRDVRASCATSSTMRDIYFEPRYIHCRPSFGDECPYLAACHNAEVNADPVGSGLYVPRVPHHDVEKVYNNGKDV